MTLQELCDKALKHAEAADRLDHGQGSVIYEAASEVLALSTLSLAYSALATIAGQCSDFELPTGGPGLTNAALPAIPPPRDADENYALMYRIQTLEIENEKLRAAPPVLETKEETE